MGYGECTIKRRGKKEPITRRYTIEMAKEAGLWGGTGDTKEKKEQSVWFKNPGRMLQQRARHLAGEDAIPEASQGLLPADIAMDLEPVGTLDVTPPLQMPQAVKQPADGPTEQQVEQDHEKILRTTREIQDRVENSASQEAAQGVEASEAPTGNGPAHEKPGLQEVLDWIAGADATVFKDTAALSMKLKGFDNKDQMIICRAWNDRSRKAKQ